MNLSAIYSKTTKGARMLVAKSRTLSANASLVLSRIDGVLTGREIMAELGKFGEMEFEKILQQLETKQFIKIADRDFEISNPSASVPSVISVTEISPEEFLKQVSSEPEAIAGESVSATKVSLEEAIRQELEQAAKLANKSREKKTALASKKPQKISRSQAIPTKPDEQNDDATGKQAALNTAMAENMAKFQRELQELADAQKQAEDFERIKALELAEHRALMAAQREAAIAKARAETEARAKREAERRAEEVALLQAKEREEIAAKRVFEEETRTAAEQQQRQLMENQRKARELAQLEIDKAAQRELDIQQKQAAKQKAAEEKARLKAEKQERKAAKNQAREAAQFSATAKKPHGSNKWMPWLSKAETLLRNFLIVFLLACMALLVLLHAVNLSLLVRPVESALSTSIQEPVRIGEIHFALWPKIHLQLNDVAIGLHSDIRARYVDLFPDISTLRSERKTLEKIEFNELHVTEDTLPRSKLWLQANRQSGKFQIKQILLKNADLRLQETSILLFNSEILLDTTGQLQHISITDPKNAFKVSIQPETSQSYEVTINAEDWTSPAGPALVVDQLKAEGRLTPQALTLNQIEARLYGGNLRGSLVVDWPGRWNMHSNFLLDNARAGDLSAAMDVDSALKGHLSLHATVESSSNDLLHLMQAPMASADFDVQDGAIGNIDLVRSLQGGKLPAVASTAFRRFSGTLFLKDGHYQYRKLSLDGGQLKANGEFDLLADHSLSGKLYAQLTVGSRTLQSNLKLSGRLGSIVAN